MLESDAVPEESSLDAILPLIYQELRRMARHFLRAERPGHTLQPTALANEAYLALAGQRQVDWSNRDQVLGVAGQLMRRVLLRHAERRNAAKREGAVERIVLDDDLHALEADCQADLISIDRALNKLGNLDPRQAQIVELRCFAGFSVEETAEAMRLSTATIKREWAVARLWLRRELAEYAS